MGSCTTTTIPMTWITFEQNGYKSTMCLLRLTNHARLQRPANFDDAVKKLGLEHALGSLRFMRPTPATTSYSDENVNRVNLPTDSAQDSYQEAGDAGEKDV